MSRTTLAVVLGIALPTLGLGGGWLWTTVHARDARRDERRALLTRSADAIGAAADESLEELRAREDARPFYLYNHFYTPPDVLSLTATIAVSPLAAAPDDPRVVGYFQVDPGGNVRTPYEAEPGASSDERAVRVMDAVRATPLAPLRAYAYLAPGASNADGPLGPRPLPVAPAVHARPPQHRPPPVQTTLANVAPNGDDGNGGNRQVTVALNSYSNMLYDQVTQAQAGDPTAQAYVAQTPPQQQATERNVVSWQAQATQQAIDTGYAPPTVPQLTTVSTPRTRPRARAPEPQAVEPPRVIEPRQPDRADAVDYTPMAFATFGDALVLWRVVSHEGASSVQGVVLDRDKVLRDWLPALVQRHAIAGASPRVVLGARFDESRADFVQAVSDDLPGVALVFPSGTLAHAAASDDRALLLEALGLLGLVLAIVVTGIVVDRAARRSAALAQQRSAFVSAVSHELRTPLTTIRMHAEMLRDGLVPEAKRGKFHADIAQESVRLARLVENVLEATRLEEGRRPVRLSEGDLAAHVRHVVEGQRALLESRGAKLSTSLPEKLAAHFDAQAVELVVVNLVENAVKHGLGDRREIDVELAMQDGKAELHVRDRGPGVPQSEREKVFERFHRVDRPGAEHVVGTGLGLALVRELARAHGGDARVTPRDGGGADFVVTLAG